jgi:hypothetical protein
MPFLRMSIIVTNPAAQKIRKTKKTIIPKRKAVVKKEFAIHLWYVVTVLR